MIIVMSLLLTVAMWQNTAYKWISIESQNSKTSTEKKNVKQKKKTKY